MIDTSKVTVDEEGRVSVGNLTFRHRSPVCAVFQYRDWLRNKALEAFFRSPEVNTEQYLVLQAQCQKERARDVRKFRGLVPAHFLSEV